MPGSQVRIEELDRDKGEGKDDKSGAKRSSSSKRPRSSRSESELRGRLTECFERIADALEQRGDDALADIIREDATVMSNGLVSLTRPFKMLRMPLLAAVAIVEPLLAFGRIGRALADRFIDRRERKRAERALEGTEGSEDGLAPGRAD